VLSRRSRSGAKTAACERVDRTDSSRPKGGNEPDGAVVRGAKSY
jgi:hypothetical protein